MTQTQEAPQVFRGRKRGGNQWKDERIEKRSRNQEKRSRKPGEIGDNRVLFTLDKWMDRVKGGKWEYLMI